VTDEAQQPTLPEVFLAVMETVHQVREAVNGYRASLLADGYSPTAAEVMAMTLHEQMIRAVFVNKGY
jgi:hypothetical protein